VTSTAATSAANDDSARAATQALSVEQFETTAKQIGSSMNTLRETTQIAQADAVSQSISLVLDAEIMTDLDDGQVTLVASTSHNQSDLRVVTSTELRQKAALMRTQLAGLDALAAQYDAITGTGPANATVSTPKTWVRTIGRTGQNGETCPTNPDGTTWCRDTHANDQDSVGLDDLQHGYRFDGPELPVFDATDGVALVPVLAGRIQIDPYSLNPQRRQPHMNFEPFQDEVMETLTPDEFAQIIATIRAHCDRLDEVHAQFARIHAQWTEDNA
jgi:hypothetical protein